MCEVAEHPITHRPHRYSSVSQELIHHRQGGHVLMATATPRYTEATKPPIMVCNGYGAGIQVVARLATALAEQEGRTVITYDEVRSKQARADPIGFRADTILSILDRFDAGIDERYHLRPTLVGWSTGGAAITLATEKLARGGEEARVGALIPTASAAIGRHATEIELVSRATAEVARGLRSLRMVRTLGAKAAHGFARYVASDVALAIGEVSHLARLDVRERLVELRDTGTKMAVIAMRHDFIFPLERVRHSLREHDLEDLLHVVDGTHINMAWDHDVKHQMAAVIESVEQSDGHPVAV